VHILRAKFSVAPGWHRKYATPVHCPASPPPPPASAHVPGAPGARVPRRRTLTRRITPSIAPMAPPPALAAPVEEKYGVRHPPPAPPHAGLACQAVPTVTVWGLGRCPTSHPPLFRMSLIQLLYLYMYHRAFVNTCTTCVFVPPWPEA